MCKYSTRITILRELFNTPEEHLKQRNYYSPLIQIIKPWVNNKMQDLLPKQKAEEKNPALKNLDWFTQDWIITKVFVDMVEYAAPSLQSRFTGSSRSPRTSIIPSHKLWDDLEEDLWHFRFFHEEYWDKLFVPIFEDFIKLMKSFKDFNMEALSDFLASNEIHDLWLIVATIKDYSDESTEDRFSL